MRGCGGGGLGGTFERRFLKLLPVRRVEDDSTPFLAVYIATEGPSTMIPMATVQRAVILAAGLGTRMLPASKSVPKEMLPVVDRPAIQYAVEEAVAAGIEHIVIVLAPDRVSIKEHFGGGSRIEAIARQRMNAKLTAQVLEPEQLANFTFVQQLEPLGTGHAIQQAREQLEEEPFALLFPDDIILGEHSCTAQLIEVYENCNAAAVIAVEPISQKEIPQYGIVDPIGPNNPTQLRGIVEKPSVDTAPSDLGVVGRYVLGPSIFRQFDKLKQGKGGELQFTDALSGQIEEGEAVFAYHFEGQRYDAGRPVGAIAASVAHALDREELREDLLTHLANLLPLEQ